MPNEEVNKLKEAYWQLIKAKNELSPEYSDAITIALNLLEKEMERKC